MKIQEQEAFIEVERAEFGPPDTPAEDDVLLNVSVRVSGYSAADQSWVVADDLERFLAELRALERKRHGSAQLVSASPDDLRLHFYSTDSAGHMAIRGHLGWHKANGFLLKLQFGFNFEPDKLPYILEYFEMIGRNRVVRPPNTPLQPTADKRGG
jgi:hypothetical protein